jgi:Fe-S cluster assembly protein SufD
LTEENEGKVEMSKLTSLITDITEHRTEHKIAPSVVSFDHAYRQLLEERPGMLASEFGGELDWLKAARHRDADRWRAEGLPTRRQEAWKYTSVSAITDSEIVLAEERDQSAAKPYASLPGEVEAELIFVNGHFISGRSRRASTPGVSVLVLSELFRECVEDGWTPKRRARLEAFQELLASSDADKETVFAAMNTSFMQDAVLVHIDPGTVVKRPIVIMHIADSKIEVGSKKLPMSSPRVFASLDRRSEAAILEYFVSSEGARHFTNAVSDLRVAEGARLSHCQLQAEGNAAKHIGTTRVRQERHSWTEVFQVSLGAKLARQDLHVSLEGEGAEAVVDGLYMAAGEQHVDNHTVIEHVVGNTQSEQLYKGVLSDQARAVFSGRIHIHQNAQKANAAQLNNNLLLSKKAEIDTKPELEIYADDVKASHGATIGQLDPEHLFYLEARAIPRREAVKMLARGFALDVIDRIHNEGIRSRVGAFVEAKFAEMHVADLVQVADPRTAGKGATERKGT